MAYQLFAPPWLRQPDVIRRPTCTRQMRSPQVADDSAYLCALSQPVGTHPVAVAKACRLTPITEPDSRQRMFVRLLGYTPRSRHRAACRTRTWEADSYAQLPARAG
jgi:hypothetical protein